MDSCLDLSDVSMMSVFSNFAIPHIRVRKHVLSMFDNTVLLCLLALSQVRLNKWGLKANIVPLDLSCLIKEMVLQGLEHHHIKIALLLPLAT